MEEDWGVLIIGFLPDQSGPFVPGVDPCQTPNCNPAEEVPGFFALARNERESQRDSLLLCGQRLEYQHSSTVSAMFRVRAVHGDDAQEQLDTVLSASIQPGHRIFIPGATSSSYP